MLVYPKKGSLPQLLLEAHGLGTLTSVDHECSVVKKTSPYLLPNFGPKLLTKVGQVSHKIRVPQQIPFKTTTYILPALLKKRSLGSFALDPCVAISSVGATTNYRPTAAVF